MAEEWLAKLGFEDKFQYPKVQLMVYSVGSGKQAVYEFQYPKVQLMAATCTARKTVSFFVSIPEGAIDGRHKKAVLSAFEPVLMQK